jgi:hypothetical protein
MVPRSSSRGETSRGFGSKLSFLGVAKHLQAKLKNEKDILRLMAIGRQRDWRFVDDFHEFLRCRV